MKNMKRLMVILAAALVLLSCIPPAFAYFSANSKATGKLNIRPIDTEIKEKVVNKEKQVVITNAVDGATVFVRARGFSGDDSDLSYSGEGWHDGGDGWWYYDNTLAPGSETTTLLVNIEKVFPEDAQVGDSFNVTVVYESARVLEGAQGTYADWDAQEGGN